MTYIELDRKPEKSRSARTARIEMHRSVVVTPLGEIVAVRKDRED